jgi:glutamyl-tRNA(Gln) amidotransferase subunit E
MPDQPIDLTRSGVQPPGELNPRTDPVLDFRDRPLDEMRPADYAELGFLSGLEVHQQLLTRSKLFCRCPAGRRVSRVDAEVLRHMRPTLSELGEYDGTALMEFKTRKEIVYLLERGTVCTYEMDDTPPFEIDQEAVRIALEMAMLCDLNLVSELHVMRKQYLDGSIPTGFQRTAMVGLTGVIPFHVPELGIRRDLRIRQLSLEEDSCREVSDVGHRITFRTDRLGMPLTEIVTEPDLLTPHELQAGGWLLAQVARATGKVRRGAGAGRQDVNVSIAGGRRVEIKGVHHHRRLPLLVHVEAFRQLNLLRVRAELQRRGVTAELLPDPAPGLPWETSHLVLDGTAVLQKTSHRPLRRALDRGEFACVVRLPGFHGMLNHATQPGLDFAHEIAERVRVIACPASSTFMTHPDDPDDSISRRHWDELARALGAAPEDALVAVWASAEDAATAAREVLIRARDALVGVPAETRQARPDGTTGFERILPGADRMYPDTDTPPLPISDAVLDEVRARIGETPWSRQARYEALQLSPLAAQRLARAPWADLFDGVAPAPGAPARRLAAALEQRLPYHARRLARRRVSSVPAAAWTGGRTAGAGGPGFDALVPDVAQIAPLVRALERGELQPGALKPALDATLDAVLAGDGTTVDDVVAAYRPRESDPAVLAARVRDVVAAAHLLARREPDAVLRWAMGEVLDGMRGRVDAAAVRAQLRQALQLQQDGGSAVHAAGGAGAHHDAGPAGARGPDQVRTQPVEART